MSNPKTYNRYFYKALLALVVIAFGYINTSGHVISSSQALPAQVELTLEQKSDLEGTAICIFNANVPFLNIASHSHSLSYIFDSKYLAIYHELILVKFKSISKSLNFFKPLSYFTQLKRFPQNSEDPSASYLQG
jgi:hypothetical protein